MSTERIRELAKQADEYTEQTVHYYQGQFDGLTWEGKIKQTRDTKFAELIVRECVNQVKEQYIPVSEDAAMMNDEHWKGYKHCGVDSVVAIREHFFGVEE